VDEMSEDARLGPEFGEHIARVLAERGASPFEAARFSRLPHAAQLAALPYLEDRSIPVRELLNELEEEVERRRAK
jgi:hypothetical protein